MWIGKIKCIGVGNWFCSFAKTQTVTIDAHDTCYSSSKRVKSRRRIMRFHLVAHQPVIIKTNSSCIVREEWYAKIIFSFFMIFLVTPRMYVLKMPLWMLSMEDENILCLQCSDQVWASVSISTSVDCLFCLLKYAWIACREATSKPSGPLLILLFSKIPCLPIWWSSSWETFKFIFSLCIFLW